MPIYPFEGVLPTLHPSAFIHPDAVIIGAVEIGPESSVWPGVVIRGDVNPIRIGSRSNIQDGAVLHVSRATDKNPTGTPLIIGDDVTVGHRVVLHACRIGDGCLIGIGAVVLDRCEVAPRCMIGATALLTPGRKTGEGELWLGSPATRNRELTPQEIADIQATTANYRLLGQRHRAGLPPAPG